VFIFVFRVEVSLEDVTAILQDTPWVPVCETMMELRASPLFFACALFYALLVAGCAPNNDDAGHAATNSQTHKHSRNSPRPNHARRRLRIVEIVGRRSGLVNMCNLLG
jgi:hypothetical protein